MKRIFTLIILTVFTTATYSQPWMEGLEKEKGREQVSFYKIQEAFNEYMDAKGVSEGYYYEDGKKMKAAGWKQFKRWEYIWEPRADQNGYFKDPSHTLKELKKFRSTKAVSKGGWSEIGPVQMPSNSTGQPNGLGRLNSLTFHPVDTNIIYVGAPSGGFWKTTTDGNTWTNLTEDLPTLGTSDAVINHKNPDEIYIGTGDRDAQDARGLGIFKTTDGGDSWTRVLEENITVSMMEIHPEHPDTIFAATLSGVYRTLDGGQNWEGQHSDVRFRDIEIKPGDPQILYATGNGDFYRSTDMGKTWNKVSTSFGSVAYRTVIAVSPDQPGYVYALPVESGNEDAFIGLYRSTDSGQNFTLQSDSPNLLGYNSDGSDNRSQAWYDICMDIDPNDADIVYVGAINVWK